VRAAPQLGIDTLTLFAFSADNWGRPRREVDAVLDLIAEYVRTETPLWKQSAVRLQMIGRRDRLPAALLTEIVQAEEATAGAAGMRLRLAIDYSAREAILAATRQLAAGDLPPADACARLLSAEPGGEAAPEVDLLIRSGGERRLSDFLLWECAYAELLFWPGMWPDFGPADLRRAVEEFGSRERRFGRAPLEAAS